MSHSVLERLREATRPAHERLEERLDILARMQSLDGRRALAARFHSLHAGMETVLEPWLADVAGLDFSARRRTRSLEADLAALGLNPQTPAAAPAPADGAEALGFMYVLEGSSLGGKVIRKQAERAGLDMTGLSFLDPYGARTGEAWRAFLSVLDRESPPHDTARGEAVARGGALGFAHAERVLLEGAAA
ncbi:biliverdin-producing heme oxygenase [Phenylobacterium sp. LjRoot164]|uniref:biliverdin-producing heme oxygenase n=1 Tax=unclassified Phenylobacterium TaxID=2640670 RepID=UPI003ECE5E76